VLGPSATIKSHHNVGGLPTQMKFNLIEPLRELFKDEVRILGKELGLPDDIIQRHFGAWRSDPWQRPKTPEVLREADDCAR
jgi:hypothetical protein